METKLDKAKTGHLFTVEVLFNEISNGLALEKLLQLLNRSDDVIDYKIVSGTEFGKLIDANRPVKAEPNKQTKPAAKTAAPRARMGQAGTGTPPLFVEQFEQLKNQNKLVRLTIVKGMGLKFDIPCRIVNYDSKAETVTVYHVDDKQVYTFKLNEVEDFSVA